MNSEADSLQALREHIDALDRQIQTLISERACCAQQVGVIKQAAGATGNFYRPEREAQVLRRVIETNPGPLSNEEMARLFREIMSACLALEEPLKIAFLGPEGTFTQAAALKHFGQSIHSIPLRAIDEVFREVEAGSADYGVVPVENSTEGVVNHTLDMFLQSPLCICGEVQMRINHHLITRAATLGEIRRIYSHRQSLAQCREWLNLNLPRTEQIEVGSNGEAASRVRDAADVAAIAGQCAADIYKLPTLVRNIEDEPNNTTRFLIIGNRPIAPSGDDKTALLVASLNRPGALFKLLEPLARHNVSMNRIESRPSRRGMWDYVFFIDLDGHAHDSPVAGALAELRDQASLFRVLGSYPKGVL
ncbi:MAG TPA: prephenate dehydratase [Candidatus Competibacteraceae bacterium]|nr:prephenate dehydratase [Candidatus Competibacteraceae bacterium]MCP5132069.1 prephenate dehydratase [Gammaproteobacteria bacterium]HPF57677.1 prephenate dehydratase [Candidatus Competibacteraceae bacterium]HRY16825.1 prephenate dehydratase [Candidatus Competibacteraceae bacterium]